MDSVLNLSILIVQRLVLHQNGVEFCQLFNGAIKNSLTASFIQDCFWIMCKDLEGLGKTWKDIKVIGGTWKDLKELGRTWKDMKGFGRFRQCLVRFCWCLVGFGSVWKRFGRFGVQYKLSLILTFHQRTSGTHLRIPLKNTAEQNICPAPYVLCQCTVVFAWKCHLFCLCAHGKWSMPRILYLSCGIPFPV